MIYRVYVKKKASLENEARDLLEELKSVLNIKKLENIHIFNTYTVEGVSKELFENAKNTIFSEPQLDDCFDELPKMDNAKIFAVEFLPGQYDQRADSAASCIQLISCLDKPLVHSMKVYYLIGDISETDVKKIKNYVINPVEAREAVLKIPETLEIKYEIPEKIKRIDGFNDFDNKMLENYRIKNNLAMDFNDIKFAQSYFKERGKNPTSTEIKVLDTYWSDHCRHTTFGTIIDNVKFEDEKAENMYNEYLALRKKLNITKPITLMNIATIGVKALKANGKLEKIDESEEINACTVKIDADVNGKTEKWLLLFKNETHNHPTEIEPFGGAATCIGGAIRDPLSGRSYVYQAMRLTGASDPTIPLEDTIKGKLPQRKIVRTAANGYSSYGNQIGLATGIVDEIYHEGYVAKHMELGAVLGAAKAENVIRLEPTPGDNIILLGGRTGRDGCGGATGSSKSHNLSSLETCGAEVQKGNAPEERKIQRLFRNQDVTKLIKRCNDFGAGGVSVAIGELADGLEIDLNKVKKKYEGLNGTELAISESQERMAVVVDKKDTNKFIQLAEAENIEATVVAKVTDEKSLIMKLDDEIIVNLSRKFLSSNGADKHTNALIIKPNIIKKEYNKPIKEKIIDTLTNLNVASKKGLAERFDSTIGVGSILMPFGGKTQNTPTQVMACKIPVLGETNTCSLMSWGYDPYLTEQDPFKGAYCSVVSSLCKLVCAGGTLEECYLTFQEYFERMSSKESWGKVLSALLGALKAQLDFEVAAIGGKDSMSGTFENINVPPTLVSFAVTTAKAEEIISNEFKSSGNYIYALFPKYDKNNIPESESLKNNFKLINNLIKSGNIISAYTPTFGGIFTALFKMSIGNQIGFKVNNTFDKDLFEQYEGVFIVESNQELSGFEFIGKTIASFNATIKDEIYSLNEFKEIYESKLEDVYPTKVENKLPKPKTFSFERKNIYIAKEKFASPKALIPVFPGTNCEYDTLRAFEKAGANAEIFLVRNLTSAIVTQASEEFTKKIKKSQIIFIPGGFSGGDEPEGSAKFITAFFRNPTIKNEVNRLLAERNGLVGGICNGFQALIKLGLLPTGQITDTDANSPTLTFNTISRHQSKIVRTRIASNASPWLSNVKVGDIYSVAISHGEGRFLASKELAEELGNNGQVMTQYVDLDGNVSNNIEFNPNGSIHAIEGILSPDGHVFGKMGHSERIGTHLYKNVEGNYDMKLFESAVKYFK